MKRHLEWGFDWLYSRFSLLRHKRQRWAFLGILLVLLFAMPLALIVNQLKVKAAPCACSVFSTPTGQSNFNGGAIELGFKFKPNVNGTIGGVRFYKQSDMSGTHTGRLWTVGGGPLATATFTNETASGWQEVTFSSPVTVTAGTTYVASVTMDNGHYVATSNYFTSDIVNGPLTALSSASSGGNGVYNTTPGAFPTSSFNAANYWIDVAFFDVTAPTVTAVDPAASTTNVEPGGTLSATFDQNMDGSSFTASTFTVKDAQGNPVSGTYSYNNATKTASYVADNGFAAGANYTATIEGGTGATVKNGGGVALASDYTWSFTISATNDCPCSLKNRANPAGSATFDDFGNAELGVKIKPTTNGYITAMRFYKPITSTETSHIGNIWNASGTKLASVTFTNESDYGWQEAKLGTPFRVYENQLYIISYGTTTATYQALAGGVTSGMTSGFLVAHPDNSAENAATGSGNRTGVFATNAGNYPNGGSPNGSYYFVDAVFSVESAPTYPLDVAITQPTTNAYGVVRDQTVTAKFSRGLDGSTVTNSTFRLFDANNNQVGGTASYDTAKGIAVFTPASPLAHNQRYTARLSASIADQGGTQLGSEYSWSFTVGSSLLSDPLQGQGGPILVITQSSNKYSQYYAEMMRAEGLNYFDVKDIATVNATILNQYDAVILSEMALSQSQADMFETWVTNGGNLIAMRPDNKLAGLLGLTNAGTTRTNQYLLIDTDTAPGKGLVDETIQFKGTADNYTLNGATAVANFYSNAGMGSGTASPAVSVRSVGSKGGTAAAFTYDLAKSVIALHQGNQAWVGQNRDNNGPARANDLFFGAMSGDIQPDWVDMSKFHIPQADEQQRLLANVLTEATKDKKPLPRFWYLPGDHKAAVIMAGDDHDLSSSYGTEKIMSNFLNESGTNCSVMDWQCIRASHYVTVGAALTNARALQFHNLGFELGDHIDSGCNNYASYAFLNTAYANSLAAWRAKYTSIPNQVSHRLHCYVWNDWDSQSRVDLNNGIRFDLSYVAFPNTWVSSRAPLMTGSGMNMRFTDADGDMLDVRQGVTNLDNTAANATSINALLDNALGADGYYGIFGTHYDMSDSYDATLYNAAKARNIPMISSAQALTWLDGRESSNFSNFSGSNGRFTFGVAAAEGANKLRAMMPIQDAGGNLVSITLAGNTVGYQTQTVKGVQYAVFDSAPGDYTVTYSDYNPNAGSGNGSGGSAGGSSGAGGTQSPSKSNKSTTSKAASSPTTALDGQQPTEVVTEEEAEVPTDNERPSERQQTSDDNESDDSKVSTGTILLVAVSGLLLTACIAGGVILWHRHSSHRFF